MHFAVIAGASYVVEAKHAVRMNSRSWLESRRHLPALVCLLPSSAKKIGGTVFVVRFKPVVSSPVTPFECGFVWPRFVFVHPARFRAWLS